MVLNEHCHVSKRNQELAASCIMYVKINQVVHIWVYDLMGKLIFLAKGMPVAQGANRQMNFTPFLAEWLHRK